MTVILVVLAVALSLCLAALVSINVRLRRARPKRPPATGCHRILFPFEPNALSQRALDTSLRLARAEDAVLVPVFLARVPLHLPLETPLPRQSSMAIPLQEAIERRAGMFGITVDARIERGRTYRHALRQTMAHEKFDRVVIAAAAHGTPGFDPDDVAWILENTRGEFVVLRPARDEVLRAAGQGRRQQRIVPGTPAAIVG
jgi:hypothetical protein